MNLPYKAWRLAPSFKPVEVVIEREYSSWLVTDQGRHLHHSEVFPTMAEAIANGRKRIVDMEADISKREARIAKKRAAIDKAESA